MRTNKFLVIALAAAGLFTACSNNDEPVKMNQGKEISFRLQGGVPSAKTTASTVANVDAFVVYGSDTNLPSLFDGVTVARQIVSGAPAGFTYAPIRYYSTGATTAAYAAYSPASTVFSAVSAANVLGAISTFDFEVVAPDASGKTTQTDLLFAINNAAPVAAPPVALAFTHALSRVFVTATNKTITPVTIQSLTLKNLNSTGRISVAAGAGTWSWTYPTDTPADYEYMLAPSGIVVPVDATPATPTPVLVTSMEQGMMILPQTTGATFELEVKYEFSNLGPQTKHIVIPSYTFVRNTQYSINIEFDGTGIYFTITVSDFTPVAPTPVNP